MVYKMGKSVENILHHSEWSEKEIEKYLRRKAKELNLICLKYSNPLESGYPDRLICLPDMRVVWVELKSKGKKPSKIQQLRFTSLRSLGHQVFVIDNKQDIDKLIQDIQDNEI